MKKNRENTCVPNGACNTSLKSMYKTGKTQVFSMVHVKLYQTVCTKSNADVSNGACKTTSNSMYKKQ